MAEWNLTAAEAQYWKAFVISLGVRSVEFSLLYLPKLPLLVHLDTEGITSNRLNYISLHLYTLNTFVTHENRINNKHILKTYYIPRIQMHRQAGCLLTYTILVQPGEKTINMRKKEQTQRRHQLLAGKYAIIYLTLLKDLNIT